VFDFFAFFRALKNLSTRLHASQDASPHFDLLVARSDSVEALASSMVDASYSVTAKLLVWSECEQLLARLRICRGCE
jgi:hypothetical protein